MTFYDGAFSSKQELANAIYEELIHRDQGLREFGGGNVQAAEKEAEEKLSRALMIIIPGVGRPLPRNEFYGSSARFLT